MGNKWDADPATGFRRRLGKSARELGDSDNGDTCPDIWELDNGDVAVIGRDLTASYVGRLPKDVVIGPGEKLVVIPRNMVISAKPDIPDV